MAWLIDHTMCPLYVVKSGVLRLQPVHKHILNGVNISLKEDRDAVARSRDRCWEDQERCPLYIEMTSLKCSRPEYKETI